MDAEKGKEAHQRHLKKVDELLRICEAEERHSRQVCRLALDLFDQLAGPLSLPPNARAWLEYASLLHDIGWAQGYKDHHKTALVVILSTPLLDFKNKERLVIGSVIRYHRKAFPQLKHDHYAALDRKERKIVRGLAAILRFANALDSAHNSAVQSVRVKEKEGRLVIRCTLLPGSSVEKDRAERNLALLVKESGKAIRLSWRTKCIPRGNTAAGLPAEPPEPPAG